MKQKQSKATLLATARRCNTSIKEHRHKRDAAIAAAKEAGATWQEICDAVGIALRTAQMAVERARVS